MFVVASTVIFPVHAGWLRLKRDAKPLFWGFPTYVGKALTHIRCVTQIIQNQVAYHEKHVVHLIYKTRGLKEVASVKLIENSIM